MELKTEVASWLYLIHFLVSSLLFRYWTQLFQFITKYFKTMNIKLSVAYENLPSAFLRNFSKTWKTSVILIWKKKCALQDSTCCFYKTLLQNGSIKNGGCMMQILHAKVFKHKRSYEIFSHIYIQIFLKIYDIYLQQYIFRQFGHGTCI